ncbi:MAG: rhomboid family intramembrane serine protease [Bacteroidota bacterium]
MKAFLQEIKTGFGNATALYRLMAINAGVFLALQLVRLICFFTGDSSGLVLTIVSWLSLPADLHELIYKPWTLVTYMFVHYSFMHLFFNLLIFYWIGKLFTEYLGNSRLWATYILSGIAGALLYVIIYNALPVFDASVDTAYLLGASAGVIGIMVGIATLLPDYTVGLLLFGPVRLKYIALFSIVLYAISIPDGNAGGNIAHLGGAFFGFIMIKQLRKGRDLTAWLVKLSGAGKKGMRVVESKKKRSETDEEYSERKQTRQETIDHILDKISQSGYSSLTTEEKDILFKASKNIKE